MRAYELVYAALGAVRQALVGLDVGTTGVKAVAISDDGEVVARAERGYPLSTPQPGWCEQDPEDWWSASQAALADLGVEPRAVGLSGQMHGLVVLDEHDRVLRPAILWNDQRTGAECEEIEARIGLDRLIELTGNRALTGFTAPKLLWLRRHEPETYARIRHVLLPKDYVRLRLTGEHAIDVADASGTLLFDVRRRDGRRGPRRARDSRRVAPARARVDGDRAAPATRRRARSGSGSTGPGRCPSCSARRASSSRRCPRTEPDAQARLHVFCHAVPGTWHAMGVMLSAAGSLPGCATASSARPRRAGPRGRALAGRVEGLLFPPYLAGERTPHADPNARGAFVGLSLRHDRGALVRAVLEGVAYGLRDSLELLRELGVHAESGRVSGGGARSALWLRIVASVLGLPLERTAESEEGAAFGAALLGGVAQASSPTPPRPSPRASASRDRIEPERVGDATTTAYGRFRELYPALDHWRNHELARVGRPRSSPVRAAASAPRSRACSQRRACKLGLASRSGGDLGLDARGACRATSATWTRSSSFADATAERFGGIDIVVANAGVGAYGPFLDLCREHLDEMIDVNLKGTIYAVRAALPHMLEERGRHRHARLGGGTTRPSVRGRLLRVEVRAGRARRARSTTSFASTASAARTSAPAASRPTSRSSEGRGRTPDALPGMMRAEDVAEVVVFVARAPARAPRILETALRPRDRDLLGVETSLPRLDRGERVAALEHRRRALPQAVPAPGRPSRASRRAA